MIITVTLNPALDKTLVLQELHPGMMNRVKSLRRDAGGKGILVSKVIEALGGESLATGIVGGNVGNYILSQLDELGIERDFIEVNAETRTNLKIVDLKTKAYTEINESGMGVHEMVIEEMMEVLESRVGRGDLVILAGSLPDGCDPAIYRKMIEFCHSVDAKVYLDCDGEALREGVRAKPELIKPNKYELAELCGCDPEDDIACMQGARELVKNGVGAVLLSLGAYGALYVTSTRCIRADGLKVPVVGRAGAGDAMTAAFALGEDSGMNVQERLRYAVAAASAKIMVEGTQAPEKGKVDELVPQVVLHEISL